jgi:hypothetical protein
MLARLPQWSFSPSSGRSLPHKPVTCRWASTRCWATLLTRRLDCLARLQPATPRAEHVGRTESRYQSAGLVRRDQLTRGVLALCRLGPTTTLPLGGHRTARAFGAFRGRSGIPRLLAK